MTRIVKDADVRRDELLDTALALFLEHGYQRTSVEQITHAVGVAKGTFYHYFTTKTDLLAQLVARYADGVFDEIEDAIQAADGTAVDRFVALMNASTSAKLGRREETMFLTSSLYTEENRALLDGMCEGWIERTRPLILGIVEQGIAEGLFDVPDANMVTEICLSLWFDYGIRIGRQFFEAKDNRQRAEALSRAMTSLIFAEERILGAKPGTLAMDVGPAMHAILSGDD